MRHLALAAAALALAGCAQFITPPVTVQQQGVGPIEIDETFCIDGFGNTSPAQNPPLAAADCTANPPKAGAQSQNTGELLVGFLIAQGVDPPGSLTATLSPSGTTVQLFPSTSYSSQLATLQGTPAGEAWIGYMSDSSTVVDETSGPPQTVSLKADFTLPPQPAGTPYSGSFSVTSVIGDRIVQPGPPSYPADRAVDCGESYVINNPPNPPTTVAVSPCVEDSATTTIVPRDLALAAPTGVTVAAGQTATIPFSAQFAGSSDPSAEFSLSAATDVPGATAAPASISFAPASNSTTPLDVSLPVPATTIPGSYTATLIASVPGQQRAATATVTVTPPATLAPVTPVTPVAPVTLLPPAPPPAPHVGLGQPPAISPHAFLASGLPARFSCHGPCTVTVDLLAYDTRSLRAAEAARWRVVPTLLLARRYATLRGAGQGVALLRPLEHLDTALTRIDHFTLIERMTAVAGLGGRRSRAIVRKVRVAGVCVPGWRGRCVRAP